MIDINVITLIVTKCIARKILIIFLGLYIENRQFINNSW